MHNFPYAAVLVATLITLFLSAHAVQNVYQYEWEIGYFKFSPDCDAPTAKDVLGVHQIAPTEIKLGTTFPGPTIRARAGDRIEVNVTNKIRKENPFGEPPERVSIHWHGIRQLSSPWSDGAAGLTESGIPVNASKLYNFTVDRPGTYLWHGHYGVQRSAGLFGLLLIDPRVDAFVPTYDGEFAITLNDWWHADVYNQTHGLDSSTNWTWVNNPQSFLIKGDSSVSCQPPYSCLSAELDCTTNKLNPTISGAGKLIWNVLPGKNYLVRVVSATSSAFLNFVIEGHVMTVLEADGYVVQPFNTTSIDILSGQTYTFNLTTMAEYPEQRVYHVGVSARDRIPDSKKESGTDPGLAVLSYNLPYANKTVKMSPTNYTTLWEREPDIEVGGPRWNDSNFGPYFANQVRALAGYSYPVPKVGNRDISLLISQIKVVDEDGYRMRWALNNISYETNISTETSGYKTPLLNQLVQDRGKLSRPLNANSVDFKKLSSSDITEKRMYDRTPDAIQGGYYLLQEGEIVTVILQNTAMYNSTASEAHPWHFHGHDFWVLGYGNGLYDPDTSPQGFNLVDPPLRNTVPVFGLGWVAIRFIAENPGVWSFHCHNEWHMHLGMMVVFAYGIDEIDPKQIPPRQ